MDKEFERMRIIKFINDKKVPYGREAFLHYYDSLKLNKSGKQIWDEIKDELQKKKPEDRYKVVERGNEKYVFYNGIDDIVIENKITENKSTKQSSIPIINIQQKNLMVWPGGSSENKLFVYNNERYMVKYNKTKKNTIGNDLTINRQTAITEYIASSILKLYGINVQEVLLGYDVMKQDYCVLCKDFKESLSHLLVTIEDFSSKEYEQIRFMRKTINDIQKYLIPKVFNRFKNLNKDEAISNWVLMSVTDWLIGNTDRHIGNIGYLDVSNLQTQDKWKLPPVWDNGASLGCYLHVDDNYVWNEKEEQKVINNQKLYQLYNGIQVNYNNIVNHKLPKDFYSMTYKLFKNKDIKGLEIFDEVEKLQYLDKHQKAHVRYAKDVYKFNFNTLQSVI